MAARTLALRVGFTAKEKPLSPAITRLLALRYSWHVAQVARCSRRGCCFSAERAPAILSSIMRWKLSWRSIFMMFLPRTAAAALPVLDKFWKLRLRPALPQSRISPVEINLLENAVRGLRDRRVPEFRASGQAARHLVSAPQACMAKAHRKQAMG